ncbi:DUF86 domain-containing protein [Bacillus mobilis]|uniref:HepT-like ribonuclease domain-containing protein n=1 Tax=Bacillus mobilis TaxID=2026190 RepID=UPI002E1A15EA|nr:DUF86 domain-containing protein [Bacillus mobilis]
MLKDFKIIFRTIMEEITDTQDFTKDMTFEEFKADRKTQKAVIRGLEIIGEAMNQIPKDFQKKYYKVDWSKWIKFRNLLIHVYHAVDLELVWNAIQEELPTLYSRMLWLVENPFIPKPSDYKKQ